MALAHRAGSLVSLGEAHTALGRVHLTRGRWDLAAEHAERAATTHTETGHRIGRAHALLLHGQALHSQALHSRADPSGAEACWREALGLFTAVGAPADAEQARELLRAAATAPAAETASRRLGDIVKT